jgi:hypothetical protein
LDIFKDQGDFTRSKGKTQYVKIMLLSAEYIGYFLAEDGGKVVLNEQVTLTFPPGGIVDNYGQPYTGAVEVIAAPIAGDDEDILEKMPGELTGFDETGTKVALGTFGMINLELRYGKKLLNVKGGMSVEMKVKIPNDQLTKAPPTIPMWYFDEMVGYWKEEGKAILTGDAYIAPLPHFSTWNLDVPMDLVKWEGTFQYENGQPMAQTDVYLTYKVCSYNRRHD